MAEQLEIDVFWSFRSPWSYLATPRLREWQERYLLKVNLRVVYPCLLYTSPSPRDVEESRMPSSA